MTFTAENVEKAVKQFYGDAVNQQEINRWLMTAQTSPQAWQFCWTLLAKDKSPEVQFFGASTLHIKIARFWHEVPPADILQLRKSLFEELIKYAEGPKMVLTRLCVVLSSFTLQTVPQSWTNAISDIITAFQQSQNTTLESSRACLVLLEILTVIPEEFESSQFPHQRKSEVRRELNSGKEQVLALLRQCFAGSSPQQVQSQALRCLSSWIQFCIPLPDIEPFIDHIFQAAHNDDYFDMASDALMNLFSHPESNRYPRTVEKILSHVLRLHPLLQKAVEDKDMDQAQGLCKLIVCAADQNIQLLLELTLSQQCPLAVNLVNMVMQCTNLPGHYPVDETSSNLPFGFWYNFQDDIVIQDREKYQALMQVYTPVYMQLVEVLLRKAQYPLDTEYNTWNAEEREDHRCYREDIADTLMYAYNLLHDTLLGSLCQLLQTSLERSTADQVRWQEVESILFAMSSISESVDPDESVFLPQLFVMLSRVPCDNYKVVSQALYLIGSYAEWIAGHPDILDHVIPLMLQGLKDVELAQPASLSLKDVVRENQENLHPYVQQILTASKEALDQGNLKNRDIVRIMACLGYVLSILPTEETMEYLNIILTPHIQQLQQLAQAQPCTSTKSGILLRLQMLSWLFGSLIPPSTDGDDTVKPSQPVLLVLQQVLPVLRMVLTKWITDAGVVENTCDMLKRALRAIMNEKMALLSDIAQLLVEMYQAVPQAAMLDLAKQILLLSASDSEHETSAQNLFDTICRTTLALIQTNARDHPDVFEGFMVLLSQLVKKNRRLYEKSGCDLSSLFDAGVLGLCMNEALTVKASSHFLIEFLGSVDTVPGVKQVVDNRGYHLVDRIVRSVSGESPRAVVDCMADILLTLNKHHFTNLCKWMNALVAQEGYPNQRVSPKSKAQFARLIVMERVNRRKIRETVQEYTLLWRGMIGTEYAAQTVNITQGAG